MTGSSLRLAPVMNNFLKNLLKIGVRIIHGHALYTGKYGIVKITVTVIMNNLGLKIFLCQKNDREEFVPRRAGAYVTF